MSTFGQAQEAGEGFVNRLYTGVENFRVTHVCPTHAELKTIYGEKAKEPKYTMLDDKGQKQCRIDVYLNNDPAEGETEITTKVSFFITQAEKLSQTQKRLYINAFGQNGWLPLDGSIPENMAWYDVTGNRPAFQGEENLIGFLRNLLNLPSLAKAETPSHAMSQFSVADFNAMFAGNFASIRSACNSPNKIGLLLGVKTTDEGKMYQDAYTRNTLRQWAKESGNFDYLRASVTEAQQNGAYSKTSFGSPDYKLREFTASETPTNESVFTDSSSPTAGASFFAQPTDTEVPF